MVTVEILMLTKHKKLYKTTKSTCCLQQQLTVMQLILTAALTAQ
jgi:hypothetical protein